ncbi:hypothetical protein F4777DRAFT_549928 [Nemania sp. FL0916]|nr:hypothetical protein F4777DRAFT_549928 [Nemania sp. FL0916]
MQSRDLQGSLGRSNLLTSSPLANSDNPSRNLSDTLWDRLLQPSILVPAGLLLLTVLYQSLHSSAPFLHARHPGEFLWDLVVTATPARLLYALDKWLHPPLFPLPDTVQPAQSSSYAAKSDLLRRILSMDSPKTIMNAVAHAGKSISSLSSAKSRRITDQPPGLGNYDNSCFQNSVLQSLSSLKPLPAYLANAVDDGQTTIGSHDAGSAATLRDLLSKLRGSQNNGMTLWTPKKLKSLDTWQQQDAQEYYSKILDEIDNEITKVATTQYRPLGLEAAGTRDDTIESQHSDDSGYQSLSTLGKHGSEARATKNPLEGLVAQRVACVRCGYSEGLSMIPFNCITLSLGVGQGVHDLFERLDSYTALESIEGIECAKCTLQKVQQLWKVLLARNREIGSPEEDMRESLAKLSVVEQALEDDDFEELTISDKCGISKKHRISSTKTKQMVIGRSPSSLAIHINRSVFDENTGQMFKNLAAVRFPSTLDLGPWCLGSAGSHTTNGSAVDPCPQSMHNAEEQWTSDPRSSMVSGDLKPSKISGPIYELQAVITHQGRHENGHYVCYRKHSRHVERAEDDANEEDTSSVSAEYGSHDRDAGLDTESRRMDRDSKWWRLSDETVWEVTEEFVLAQGGVFMLFYDCVDHNSVLVPESSNGDISNTKDEESKEISRIDEAGIRPCVKDGFHGTQAGLGTFRDSDVRVSPSNSPTYSKKAITVKASKEFGYHMTSCLYPLLEQDEHIDPMIPSQWQNS